MAKSARQSSLTLYKRLLRYVKPYWGYFAISILGFELFAATQPMLANMFNYFVAAVERSDETRLLGMPLIYGVPVTILGIVFIQGLGSFLGGYYLGRVTRGVIHDLRCDLFDNLLTLPNRYFDNNNSGHLISRITFNVTTVTGAISDAIKVVIREGLTVVALVSYLLWANWRLTLVLVVILPPIGWMVTTATKKFRRLSKAIQVTMGDVTHVASETIQSYRVVRSFGGEAYERKRFYETSADNMKKALKMMRTQATYTPTLQLLIYSGMAMLMYLVLYLRGDASAGELVAYVTAAGMLPKPIRQLSEVNATIQKGLAGAENIFQQLDETPEPDLGTEERDVVRGHLEVRHLSFTYPGTDQRVLEDISFVAEPGQMVALVGRSGSGKSTLASLIPRFYHHPEGQILLDGLEVEDYKLTNLRRHIALVTQQVNLFNDTITNNIAYGDLASAPFESVLHAARDANADEFIQRLPLQYQTLVGENGVLLSGGQRQRLAIARALLKDAPVLILDEATSSLDTESERHIQQALDRAVKGRTTLVIAHRLTTIEKADLILVMDQGRIVERGRHQELLERNGYYARLHAKQFKDDPEPAQSTEAQPA